MSTIVTIQSNNSPKNSRTDINNNFANLNADKAEKNGDTLTNPTITNPIFTNGAINFNAPRGFLINGKISVTVASNNLTVAVKTIAGNDPSASDPVYCRIGDTVRSITSALSVTKNAGTNWCNAGGADLATQEVDYFIYLGYNATDGVVIGFSRYPGANQYNDFSTTTTNEKYCAISTITNAASTDYYEVIGRFAATLSASASFNWSVPVFTAINLISRPIYETRLLTIAPTLTWTGTAPTGSPNTSYKYRVVGRMVHIYYTSYNWTAGATVTALRITIPFISSGSTRPILYGQVGVSDTPNLSLPTINFQNPDINIKCTSAAATAFFIGGAYPID